jgi:two-component system phosphate regulon sensor histidine kinase PhoR
VRDNGAGIPARHLPRLTERFYRVDASRSRERGGTGLGLAIVRQILDMHDARLSISSEEGHGATFSCLFPASMTLQAGSESPAEEVG